LTTGVFGDAPILITGGCWAQPVVVAALQVAVSITATVPAVGSAAYRVRVAASTTLTLAIGCPTGISATGAQPVRFPAWQVAALSTSIWGRLVLLA
jgi:hypothetical protein